MQSHPTRLMILVAGPYRSGTGDDPAKLAANVAAMEAFAMPLFRAGHVPLVGERLGLPLAPLGGSARIGDAARAGLYRAIAERLSERRDALLLAGVDAPSGGGFDCSPGRRDRWCTRSAVCFGRAGNDRPLLARNLLCDHVGRLAGLLRYTRNQCGGVPSF